MDSNDLDALQEWQLRNNCGKSISTLNYFQSLISDQGKTVGLTTALLIVHGILVREGAFVLGNEI